MQHSESLKNLGEALAKAQSEVVPAVKCSKNPFFKSTYADLSAVHEACKEALSNNGLSVVQGGDPHVLAGHVAITTRLLHSSGEWIESTLVMPTPKNDPQGVGSAMTYARRYSLASMMNVPLTDDDGEGAIERIVKTNAKTGETMKQTDRGYERSEETIKAIEQVIKEISEIRTFNKLTVDEATKVMGKKPQRSSSLNELKEMRDALADFMERRTAGELTSEEIKLINGEIV